MTLRLAGLRRVWNGQEPKMDAMCSDLARFRQESLMLLQKGRSRRDLHLDQT
jgi:hypothetical protein